MDLILGIDLACRAAHQASLARADGTFVWTGRKFFTRPADLDKLWADLQLDIDEGDTLRVVMEPTRNAWAESSPPRKAARSSASTTLSTS